MAGRQVLILLCLCWPTVVTAQLRLDCFQHADAALTVHAGGDFVDPYFVNRALITAHQIGTDIQAVARRWIAWSLQHQLPDGHFARYCLQPAGQWRNCAAADADDAVLGLWQQLLYLVSPGNAHHGPWQRSRQQAQGQLDALLDERLGVYQVSRSEPIHLLMDNIEIFDALTDVSRQQQAIGAGDAARRTARRATQLEQSINRVFWREQSQRYDVATKGYTREVFYPHVVAQVYPWLFDLRTPLDAQRAYARWRARHGARWLSFEADKYPWGLIAAAADKLGDHATARTWLARAEALRYTERWNILEEAIFQALSYKYDLAVKLACPKEGA